MEGPDPRSRIGRIFDETMKEENNGVPVPLTVRFLLDGHCRQGIDLNDPAIIEHQEVEKEDVSDACEHLTVQIQDEFENLIKDGELLHRNQFGLFISLSPSDWQGYFGKTPPGNIDSWKPVVEMMNAELISSYQLDMEDWGHDMSIPEPIEPFVLESFDFQESSLWSLSIKVDPATELDRLGTMSRPQALVYVLRSYGYTTEQTANLIEKKVGTTSSHGSRANKKAARYRHAVELLNFYDERLPSRWGILGDRIGNVYEDTDGTQIRVLGGDNTPSGGTAFYVQLKDGTVEQYSNSAFEDLNRVDGDHDDFPEIPEMFRERGFSGEPIDIDESEPLFNPGDTE